MRGTGEGMAPRFLHMFFQQSTLFCHSWSRMTVEKRRMRKSRPSSLHHYTSVEALVALLNGASNKDKKANADELPYFTFHASDAY